MPLVCVNIEDGLQRQERSVSCWDAFFSWHSKVSPNTQQLTASSFPRTYRQLSVAAAWNFPVSNSTTCQRSKKVHSFCFHTFFHSFLWGYLFEASIEACFLTAELLLFGTATVWTAHSFTLKLLKGPAASSESTSATSKSTKPLIPGMRSIQELSKHQRYPNTKAFLTHPTEGLTPEVYVQKSKKRGFGKCLVFLRLQIRTATVVASFVHKILLTIWIANPSHWSQKRQHSEEKNWNFPTFDSKVLE